MGGDYLIPANSKKSRLLFSLFTWFDLVMFGLGVSITLILLMFVPLQSTLVTIVVLAPGLVTGFLVMPIPNYHNVLTFLQELINFYSTRRQFEWEGWCVKNGRNKR